MKQLTTLGLAALLAISIGCDRDRAGFGKDDRQTAPEVGDIGDMTNRGVGTAGQGHETPIQKTGYDPLAENRRAFVADSERRIDKIDRKIEQVKQELEQAATNVTDETKEAKRKSLEALRDARDRIATRLQQAKDKTDAEWEEFKRDVESSFDELSRAYNDLLARAQIDEE